MSCQVTLVGNIARNPEFKGTEKGGVEMKTAVAVNWGSRDREQSAFFEVSWFMSQELYQKIYYIYEGSKGKKVLITGDLKPRKGKDGKDYAWLNVYANSVEMLTPKGAQPEVAQPEAAQPQAYQPPVQPQPQPQPQPQQYTPPPLSMPQPPQAPPAFPIPPMQPRANTGNPLPPPPPMVG